MARLEPTSRVGSVTALLGRVAKWQTRWLQVPVFARTWGFKSPLAHDSMDFRSCLLQWRDRRYERDGSSLD